VPGSAGVDRLAPGIYSRQPSSGASHSLRTGAGNRGNRIAGTFLGVSRAATFTRNG
jgi:hypothetical protein